MVPYKLKDKVLGHIRSRNGAALIYLAVAMGALALLIIPMTRWYISMNEATGDLQNRLELQSIIQDRWSQINAASYDEFKEAIATKGTTWTENIGDKYKMTIKFSSDGKYVNAKCNVGTSAGANDRHCRKATITLTSTKDASTVASIETTKVSSGGTTSSGDSAKLKELENQITDLKKKSGRVNLDYNRRAGFPFGCLVSWPWGYTVQAPYNGTGTCSYENYQVGDVRTSGSLLEVTMKYTSDPAHYDKTKGYCVQQAAGFDIKAKEAGMLQISGVGTYKLNGTSLNGAGAGQTSAFGSLKDFSVVFLNAGDVLYVGQQCGISWNAKGTACYDLCDQIAAAFFPYKEEST